MRKIGITLVLAVFLFSLPKAVFALSTPVHNFQKTEVRTDVQNRIIKKQGEIQQLREEKKQEIQQRLEERQTTREVRREEIKQRLSEKRREIIQRFWERMYRRFLAAISRLETLIARIESRLAIIKENNENINTKAIEEEISKARGLLTDASALLSALNSKISEALLDSENPKEDFKIVRTEIIEIKNKLVEVHSILVHVIGDIKGLRTGTTKPVVSPRATIIPTTLPIPTK